MGQRLQTWKVDARTTIFSDAHAGVVVPGQGIEDPSSIFLLFESPLVLVHGSRARTVETALSEPPLSWSLIFQWQLKATATIVVAWSLHGNCH